MAHATHLTISTADRIRLDGRRDGGFEDEDGENEVRQEVQVSVTYALDPGDTDLVALAEAKAVEVKRTHEAVWNRIGAFSNGAFSNGAFSNGAFSNGAFSDNSSGRSNGSGSSPGLCSGHHEEDEDGEDNDDPDDGSDEDPLAGLPHHGDDPFSGGPSAGGAFRPHPAALTGRENPFPTRSVIRSHDGYHLPPANGVGDGHRSPEPDAEPLTGPQKILIRSRAGKAGLTPYALESLLYQQFKVWKVAKLTKAQANSALEALERDPRERDPKEKDSENKDGKEGTSHADSNGRRAAA